MKWNRKAFVIGLSLTLMLSSLPPALAEVGYSSPNQTPAVTAAPVIAEISKEEAIQLAKSYVEIPEGFTLEGVNYNSNYYYTGHGVWNMSFVKKDENRHYGNAHVTIDAVSGQLNDYSLYEQIPGKKPQFPPMVNFEQAKAVAHKFVAKVDAAIVPNLVYNNEYDKSQKPPLSGDVRYHIRYDRKVNGIRFGQNQISVTVDGEGRIVGYNRRWDDSVRFDTSSPAISQEEAAKYFRDQGGLSLSYKMPWGMRRNNEPQTFVSYQPSVAATMLDAQTGALLDDNGNTASGSGSTTNPLTEKPLATKPSNLQLTQEQAIETITSMFTLPEKAELVSASYQENSRDNEWSSRSTWHINWRVSATDNSEAEFIWASVDSNTGEIISFSKDKPYIHNRNEDAAAVQMKLEEAQSKAVEFVKKALPHYSDQLYLAVERLDPYISKEKQVRDYGVNFQRLIHGIRSEFENVYVRIDAESGEIIHFSNGISTINYPETAPEVLSAEEAKAIYYSQYTIELCYFLPSEYKHYDTYYEGFSEDATKPKDKTAKLVYKLIPIYTGEQIFLDAITGDWRNAGTGEVTSIEAVVVKDIEGHWAEHALQLMIDYKALDIQEGLVFPNAKITRGEMIKMLLIARNGGYYRPFYGEKRAASFKDVAAESPYFSYVEAALDQKLISNAKGKFDPEGYVSREELAVMIVRALGYETLAEHDGLFVLNVKDAEQINKKGQVSIVIGLGIMSAADGNFYPDVEMTRAQASSAFFRFLKQLAQLQGTAEGY
jgi:Zn-dependent metalloprotease